MSKLKSGVYLVRFKDINNFIKDAEKIVKNTWSDLGDQSAIDSFWSLHNGWHHNFDDPQKNVYETLTSMGRSEKTVKQLVIPFSLDQEKRRVGYWTNKLCFESDVEETMKTWNDWYWPEKHIEFYQSKKLIL